MQTSSNTKDLAAELFASAVTFSQRKDDATPEEILEAIELARSLTAIWLNGVTTIISYSSEKEQESENETPAPKRARKTKSQKEEQKVEAEEKSEVTAEEKPSEETPAPEKSEPVAATEENVETVAEEAAKEESTSPQIMVPYEPANRDHKNKLAAVLKSDDFRFDLNNKEYAAIATKINSYLEGTECDEEVIRAHVSEYLKENPITLAPKAPF